MLQATQRAKVGQPYHELSTSSLVIPVETLDDLIQTKKTSVIAQKIAELPAAQFEQVREGASTITRCDDLQYLDGHYSTLPSDP